MLTSASVARLVVTYNSADALSWQAEHSAPMDVLAVDNASSDASVATAERLGWRVLAIGRNAGFGGAIMAGLAALDTEFVLVVNPDAAVPAAGLAALQRAAAAYPDADLLLPALRRADGRPWFRHDTALERRVRNRIIPDGDCCVAMLSGAAFFVRREPFLAFGGFDPAIFLYFEDDDLALRYRRARRPIVWVAEAPAHHLGNRSSAAEPGLQALKNRAFGWSLGYVQTKHGLGDPRLTAALLAARVPLEGVTGRLRHVRRDIERLQGLRAFLRGEPSPFPPA